LERLRALGADALQAVIQLAGSKSPAVRLRACELLLEYDAPKATAALRSALPKAPRALPLMQKLRARPDLHEVFLKDGAPTLEQWLSALGDRRQYHQMLQKTETQIMLTAPNAPALDALFQKIHALAANEYDYWRMLVRVPHERITQTLLTHPEWLRSQCYEHFLATLDYRLIPILRSVHPQFWREQMRQLTQHLPDAAFLPDALRGHPDLVKRFGEPAEVVKPPN
jgi:ribosomal protein S10